MGNDGKNAVWCSIPKVHYPQDLLLELSLIFFHYRKAFFVPETMEHRSHYSRGLILDQVIESAVIYRFKKVKRCIFLGKGGIGQSQLPDIVLLHRNQYIRYKSKIATDTEKWLKTSDILRHQHNYRQRYDTGNKPEQRIA